jgi:hypothetical protein
MVGGQSQNTKKHNLQLLKITLHYHIKLIRHLFEGNIADNGFG